MSLPSVIVFDLDGTLWSPEMYELWGGGAPFTAVDGGKHVTDRKGRKVRLLADSREVLENLLKTDAVMSGATTLGIASTCDEPSWARECLEKFCLRGADGKDVSMGSVFLWHEIFHANKQEHFRRIRKAAKADFADMMFFDNQNNNISAVKKLGVHCVYTPRGQTHQLTNDGFAEWRKQKVGGR